MMASPRKAQPVSFSASRPLAAPGWLDQASRPVTVRPLFALRSSDESGPGQDVADAAPEENPEQRARIAEAVAREVAALRKEAEEEGRAAGEAAGRAAGEAAGREALQQVTERVGALVEELSSLRKTILDQTEQQVVELCLTVAQAVVERELSDDGDYARRMVRQALDLVADGDEVEVRLSPADHDLLRHELPALAEELPRIGSLLLRADPEVESGCVVETRLCRVDATAASRLQNICDALMGRDPDPLQGDNR